MKLLLIDGTNMAYRWFSNPPKMLEFFHTTVLSLVRSFGSTAVLVCFDNKGSSFRKSILEEYKGHRTKNLTEDQLNERTYFYSLIKQLPEILAQWNIPCLSLEYVETDDILAYVCKHYSDQLDDTIILSSDKDMYQLFQFPNVRTYSLTKQEWMDVHEFRKKYNIEPSEWPLVKAMAGDVSDNIPGLPLVGEKRALGYITEYGTDLDILLNNLEAKKKKGKIDQTVLGGRDLIEKNLRLIDLVTHCDEILEEYDQYIEIIQMFLESEGLTIEQE